TPDKQYTYISKLSGGEKKRLQLLIVLFKNPNFLILDEPTNDLDLPTLSVLEQFLETYQGCVIIVSHDRYFMDKLVDHLFIFEGNGIIKDFPGTYTQYRIWQKEQDKTEEKVVVKPTQTSNSTNQTNINKKKASFKEKREFEILEKEISALEKEKEALTTELSNTTNNYETIEKISTRLLEINNHLEVKEMRWLELSELL
ncbi:MAG TPA: ATP-binding cassette domain-containing protein, partial [Chitinophagaceae bacterium]|nr:ATP-binding cassette domain-containing protein [Chitinophagaceae bacterium]